tara:strand:+ start:4006 stop:5193 length:1188 start_codon:yes stop_codon:yes gene_type:complete
MSHISLKKLRDTFESKWYSGAFKFGYLSDINADHNIDYPLLLVTPPNNILPNDVDDISLYEFECHVLKPHHQNQSGSLDVMFDLLEQEVLVWLQRVLDSYTKSEVILVDEINVERQKERFNDKLNHLTVTFTLNTFRKSFGDYDMKRIMDLTPQVWLRSDIGVKTTYEGGVEVVSKWLDQSGFGNHYQQTTSGSRPRYYYEMSDTTNTGNTNPYINFDGSNDSLECVSADLGANGLTGNNTFFYIVKHNDINDSTGALFSVNTASAPHYIINLRSSGTNNKNWGVYAKEAAASGTDVLTIDEDDTAGSIKIKVRAATINGTTLKVYANGAVSDTVTNSDYVSPTNYGTVVKSLIGSDGTAYVNAQLQELIIFNSVLSDESISVVTNYLNHKYNIY